LDTVAVASVIGPEFDAADVAACAGLPRERTVELLGEALSLGLVNAAPDSFQTYRFSHAVIRETLHEDLAPARRGALHARIADVLEQRYGDPEIVSRLAQHYLEVARAGGGRRKAGEYARRAADHALHSLAYQEASDQYELVLGLLEDEDASDERLRCELLLALGEARSKAGEAAEARESFLAAADAARRLGARHSDGLLAPGSGEAASLFARAALGLGGIWLVTGIGVVDEPLRDLLEEALAALPEEDGALRARVLARLATELRWSDADDRRDTLSRSAVEVAPRLRDASTLGYALIGRYWALWGPDNVEERRATATEVVALGVAAADDTMALAGHTWRIAAALELGDVEAVDRDFEEVRRLAEKTRQPYYRWWSLSLEVMRALSCGRLDTAERLATETLAVGQEVQAGDAVPGYGVQMATLRREQGRLAEVEESLAAFIAEYPGIAAWRCALAYSYAEVGGAAAARSELERLAVEDFRDIPRDQQWLTAIALIGEVAAFLGDARRAGLCYELLLPYRDRNIVLGSATAFYGSVAHFLGVLAAFLSKPADAARHFETALAMNARMGARPFFARTQFEYARMLLASGRAGDPEKARVLLEEARATARRLGIRSLERKLAALSSPAPAEAVAEDLPAFRLEGDYWVIVHEGRVARVRDTRGMRYLEYLVRHPGRELHALDLASAVQGSGASSESPPGRRGA
ncbi:MAG: hypothetical protein ACREQ9_18740, partial [Candidatus Binatia bacterium]